MIDLRLKEILEENEGKFMFYAHGRLYAQGASEPLWVAPNLDDIQEKIRTLVTEYFGDNWVQLVLEYGVDYLHGHGLVWSIVNHTVYFDDDGDSQGDDFEFISELENSIDYASLAEALIDSIERKASN